MKIAFFDTHKFDRTAFEAASANSGHLLHYFEPKLNASTAELARGHDAICVFVNDHVDAPVLDKLAEFGVKLVALRCAGFNNVDLPKARTLGIRVVRVPEYSPNAVAEHATALLLTLNRKIHRSFNRVREGNFTLDGLVGFDLKHKTVGIVGTGKIGASFTKIMKGFGCNLIAFDVAQNKSLIEETDVQYTGLENLFSLSDIISLHVPLLPQTHHFINEKSIAMMKDGVFLINTSRGGLIDTTALIEGLKSRKIGAAALDVYEEEEGVFFQDLSGAFLQDDVLARLLTFPNVLVTSHQAFLTHEALINIARTTLDSLDAFAQNEALVHEIKS